MIEQDIIVIPVERIPIVIGKKGSTKKHIEKLTDVKIIINSKTGEITLNGNDAYSLHKAKEVIMAIALGFSPEKSLLLLDDSYYLETIDLREMFRKDKERIEKRKGRVIGKKGIIRREIEKATCCFISVYGNNCSILGNYPNIEVASRAVRMLIEGTNIESVKKFLKSTISVKKTFRIE